MKSNGIIFIALLFAILSRVNGTNYCSASLCRGAKHIACGNSGALAASCASNAKIMPINTSLQAAILKKHNTLRNTIAKGVMARYKPAVRMATMQWDPELAKLAVLNVKQCQMKHDACRNTDKFHYAGQNLAYTAWSGTNPTVQATAISHIQLWFDEYKDASMQYINKYSNPPNGAVIGHFTQVVQQKATHVGCGILRQTKGGLTYQFMACNYAFTNILDRPIYTSGAKGGAKCTTGTNATYKFLCSIREKFAVNTA